MQSPPQPLGHGGFKNRWDAAVAKNKQDVATEKALNADEEEEDEAMPVEDDDITKMGKGMMAALPGKYRKGTPEHLTATAAQLLSIYVSLNAEPGTRNGVQKLVAESSLSGESVEALLLFSLRALPCHDLLCCLVLFAFWGICSHTYLTSC